jgi:adenosylhomocysteine nucleosidase
MQRPVVGLRLAQESAFSGLRPVMIADFPNPLVVMALPLEAQEVFSVARVPVLFTGVGKVNAAYALTRRLAEYRHAGQAPPRVLNFGTAGSRSFPAHALVECHNFVQRDMDATLLGVPAGATPFEETPITLNFERLFPHLPSGTCGSGDSFVATPPNIRCDVVDMEAYALAKVCWLERLTFGSVKFISDGADSTAHEDWAQNAHRAAQDFLQLYRSIAS